MSIEPSSSNQTPVFIYDGDCGFCYYCVKYLEKVTGSNITYQPYQTAKSQFPAIPVEEFKRAVKYASPDGRVCSGAKATFSAMNTAKGNSIWLTLYRKLPGFAFLSEKAYTLISTHRSFFYFWSIFFWGKNPEPPRYDLISWFFVRGIALIFLIAFVSFGTQALGLIGSQGIIPTDLLTKGAKAQLGTWAYWFLPMVFWFNHSDLMIQVTCWGGALSAVLLFFNFWPRINLILLYLLYLSLCNAGQSFMSFQWDMFLLEAGILSIFLYGSTKTTGIWLMRWLLFRFILGAGLVKILSGDPAWQHLYALSIYFITEPLPTPLAWYAAQLPAAVLTFGTAAALLVELVIPFFIFFPRRLRMLAAFAILFMQILILITGNYNFFNIQTMLLCLVLFDDAALRTIVPQKLQQNITRHIPVISAKPYKTASFALGFFIIFTVSLSLIQFYLKFGGTPAAPLVWANNIVAPLRLVNTYGPFAVITTPRNEIIIEGSNNGVDWQEYDFKYKPGDINRPLQWNIPMQPRLDWQMWFAALSSPEQNPWFLNFITRLLQNSAPVIQLLEKNPFGDQAPRYIRAEFYEYQFTNSDERKATGAIWTRNLTGSYLPPAQLK